MSKLFLNFQLSRRFVAIPWRFCSRIFADKDSENAAVTYTSTSSDYRKGKKYAVARLQELFKLHHTKATELVMRFKKTYKVMNKVLSNNYHFLKSFDVSDEVLLKQLDVLADKDIVKKVRVLETLPLAVKDTLPLILLRYRDLDYFVKRELNGENRLSFLSQLFESSTFEVAEALAKRQFLLKIGLNKVQKNFQILIDNGINREEICNDFWVLQYNEDVIKERIEIAKQRNISKIKTWMIRSPIDVLDRYCQRRSDNKQILGDATLTEYLSQRLQCSLEIAKLILLKHPALSNKHMKKIKDIIDFLLDYGFTPLHLVKHSKILLHSVETTAKRLNQLKAEGLKLDSLYILTKSQKQYINYYDNLVKGNKSKIKENV